MTTLVKIIWCITFCFSSLGQVTAHALILDQDFGSEGKINIILDPKLGQISDVEISSKDVYAVVATDGDYGNLSRSALAFYDSKGSITSSDGKDNIFKFSIKEDGEVYTTGCFDNQNSFLLAGFSPSHRIRKIDVTNGKSDEQFNQNANEALSSLNIYFVQKIYFQSSLKRFLVVGFTHPAPQEAGHFTTVSAINVDGSLDKSYGENGMIVIRDKSLSDASTFTDHFGALYAKIGMMGDNSSIVKYTVGGKLDQNFGFHGSVTLQEYYRPDDMNVDEFGRIYFNGPKKYAQTQYCLIVNRLTAAGAWDTTFGNGGSASTCTPTYYVYGAMAINSKGEIYSASSVWGGPGSHPASIAIAGFDASGVTISGASTPDVFQERVTGSNEAAGLSVLRGGKTDSHDRILLWGSNRDYLYLVRLKASHL